MADYKDIFGRLAGKVREAADSSGVLDIYAQGQSAGADREAFDRAQKRA